MQRVASNGIVRGIYLANPVAPGLRRTSQAVRQLRPRLDVELAEHLVQVVLDRARADEELSGDLPVAVPLRGEVGNLRFLRRELAERIAVRLRRVRRLPRARRVPVPRTLPFRTREELVVPFAAPCARRSVVVRV